MAQGDLPSAGELESGDSPSETSDESTSEENASGDSPSETSDESASEENVSGDSESSASDDREGSTRTDGSERSDETSSNSDSTASDSEDQRDNRGKSEQRGKVVETNETVEKEIEGAHSGVDHIDRVQEGVNIEGVPGFQHIVSARPRKPMTFRFSLGSAFTSGANVVRQSDQNRFFGGRLNLQGTFLEYFSANIGFRARNNVNSYGRPRAMLALGDLDVGLRGHYSPLDGIDLGFGLNLDVPSGFQIAGPDFSGTSVTPRLLGTFDVAALSGRDVPLEFHANVGYRADNTSNLVPEGVRLTRIERFAHDIGAYDYVEFGLGAQYDLPYVSPFMAWNLSVPVAGDEGVCDASRPLPCAQQVGFQSYPDTLSLGLQAEPIERLALQAAVDLGLTPDQAEGVPTTPPYAIMLNASWTIDMDPRVERITRRIETIREVERMPPRGRLVGEVLDAETGESVEGARIAYMSHPERTSQMTGDARGAFESYGFEPKSEVKFEITHPDYHSKTLTRTISEGKQKVEIELNPKPRKATVRGTVVDADGNPVGGATVSFNGPQSVTVQTDGSGSFSQKVDSGDYTLSVSAPDYMTGGRDLALNERDEKQLRLSLESSPDEDLASLEGDAIEVEERIEFETGSADLAGESEAVLDQVAATLLANPNVQRIEVQGHTDNTGNESENMTLSQKRAETVKQYLVDRGIAADRMVAKGYGSKQPRMPNISPRNRRLNRRVEFKVLEK
jgi:outer membrane protein OmpA-like peptidoglycan-associated protein